MVSGRINSACSQFWSSTMSLVQDCMPRRAQDDIEPIIPEEDRKDMAARLKSRLRLARLSGAVCGIEFCYAAETAFVSPVLLRIGIPQRFMTLIWCLSPVMGLFLMPLLGSASDRCRSSLGRRRPFIILLSIGVVLGLILVPYGWPAGQICGISAYRSEDIVIGNDTTHSSNKISRSSTTSELPMRDDIIQTLEEILSEKSNDTDVLQSLANDTEFNSVEFPPAATTDTYESSYEIPPPVRACGMAFTIIGVMLLDFNCDAAQSPARAYLIDVTDPADHAKGLATFSFMAGLGGAIGYAVGGIPWGSASDNDPVSLQVRVVFGIVLVIFIIAVILTVTAEREKTLYELFPREKRRKVMERKRKREGYQKMTDQKDPEKEEKMEMETITAKKKSYGSNAPNPEIINTLTCSKDDNTKPNTDHSLTNGSVKTGKLELVNEMGGDVKEAKMGHEGDGECVVSDEESMEDGEWDEEPPQITIGTYLMSILLMPCSLRILCLTHLMGWMSLLCYSLYFTDFVGQAVYKGDPTASPGSLEREMYSEGVRMGSFAMAMYSITCSVCSYNVDKLINKIGAKPVYIANHLIYSISMVILANVRTIWATFLFSACAGIQYSTLFTLPFVLLAHYHSSNMFESPAGSCESGSLKSKHTGRVRGLGTDIALVQGMVFVAQLVLSSCMGTIVQAFDSTVVVIVAAAILSFLGAIFASQVTYAGL